MLLTTFNPKKLGGVVTLSSIASTRLFFDYDISETDSYMARFGADSADTPTVNSSSSAVTKVETVFLNEIHKFIENETPQMASFIYVATITYVLEEYGWYFIACSGRMFKVDR